MNLLKLTTVRIKLKLSSTSSLSCSAQLTKFCTTSASFRGFCKTLLNFFLNFVHLESFSLSARKVLCRVGSLFEISFWHWQWQPWSVAEKVATDLADWPGQSCVLLWWRFREISFLCFPWTATFYIKFYNMLSCCIIQVRQRSYIVLRMFYEICFRFLPALWYQNILRLDHTNRKYILLNVFPFFR